MQEQKQSDKAKYAGNTACRHGQDLLGTVADTDSIENSNRRKKTNRMPGQNSQDAEMKQDTAPDELPTSQKLAGLAAPGIGVTIKAQDASTDK